MQTKNETLHLFRQLFQLYTSRWQRTLPDITRPRFAVMHSLAATPEIEQIALIDVAVRTKAAMLSHMEKRKRVRHECAPNDKRRRFTGLTTQGRRLPDTAIPRAALVDKIFLKRLSPEQQTLFSQLIRQMVNKQSAIDFIFA
ncbi:winged helix-turn-helix transcriptional regulator [Enterobacteriaceae bacterium YMB-R22]|jgi:DNA-binding MarR family transcriptional regulator|nr:MarR family winged helix-turn-helix transcriptional regulator [Tenebrionicola larvae]MBV4413747.1 winged helix-turn-helix transcriptional regulator [Tenebrionicola larvae]